MEIFKRKCLVCKTKFEVKSNFHWLCSAECARVKVNEALEKKKAQIKKTEWTKEKAQLKISTHTKEYKKALQNEINKLSRMIDAKFNNITCIDCNKTFGKQIDAAHFHSTGSNSSLRYHLDNLHSAKSDCNQYSNKHISGYKLGLIDRYGKVYAEYVIEQLPLMYPLLKLTNNEIYEKLAIVRKLVRDFDTFKFDNALMARLQLNKIIGIYH